MKKNFKNKKNSGYTLIETIISVSLFIVIVTIGMGALLNANLLYNKSKDTRSIMDNLSFTMEDMSRNLRTGYVYHCVDDGNLTSVNTHSCPKGGGISFKTAPPTSQQWVYFIGSYNSGPVGIYKSTDGGSTFVDLTPVGIVINTSSSYFTVVGAEPPSGGDSQQPLVIIHLVGTIQYKTLTLPFSLQTSVSQREIDI